jgi:anti-sigma factor RsiW
MASDAHVGDRISAWLQGRLDAPQAEQVSRHLASCGDCGRERDLLREGQALLPPLPEAEPRPGFAARVALVAADRRNRPLAAPLWRWAFGGMAAAAVAAAVLLAVRPQGAGEAGRGQELLLARLELYEDLSVMQNREALENLDVVEQLDQVSPSEVRTP